MKSTGKLFFIVLLILTCLYTGGTQAKAAANYPPADPGAAESFTDSLRKINGKWFYFDQNGIAITKTLKQINGNYYYFGADGAAVTKTLKKIDGNYYYFGADGIAITKTLKKTDGHYYYFDADGTAVTGTLQKVDEKYYYFDSKGQAVTEKWKTINGKKYYFRKNGSAATESCRINGKYYVFNLKGQLLTPTGRKMKKVGSEYYYINEKGQPVTGWRVLREKSAYSADIIYVYKNGKCARNETVDKIKFNKNAYAINSQRVLARMAAEKFIRKCTNSSDSISVKLKKSAQRVVATFSYTGSQRCSGFKKDDWVYRAAIEALATDSGDCFYIAATIGVLADALGFENVSVIHLAKSHAYVRIGKKGNYIYYDNMGPHQFTTF
ncbi:MAG TPA: hypothetical protein DF613_01765 [Lachnospiraceae bacterium]|nr:hypothetical protein [Lachnospiraceae bacterium]